MSIARKAKVPSLVFLLSNSLCVQAEEAIDASDPTKIYSYAGPGYKYTEYSNGDHLQELRAVGNLGLSDSDMVMFELGYGKYSGTVLPGEDDTGIAAGQHKSIFNSKGKSKAPPEPTHWR